MTESTQVPHTALRGVTAIASTAVTGWTLSDAAVLAGLLTAITACLLNLCMLIDWWWKRFGKAVAIRRGWIKGPPREWMDSTGNAPLERK